MAWNITGRILEACSCHMLCPCVLGPAHPDQGWCSAAVLFNIQQGNSDGVNVEGRKVVFVFDMPGDFVGGNGTGRIYIDQAATADQRRELEAIFQGKKGGPWEAVDSLITEWLPTQYTTIEVQSGDNPSFTVGNVGQVKLQPIKTQDGRPTRVENSPVWDMVGFKQEGLAQGDGSHWFDPDMRPWVSGGMGAMQTITWSGS